MKKSFAVVVTLLTVIFAAEVCLAQTSGFPIPDSTGAPTRGPSDGATR